MRSELRNFIAESEFLTRVYAFAQEIHRGEKLANGEPYLNHVIETTHVVFELGSDEPLIALALLHDAARHDQTVHARVRAAFGETTAVLLRNITNVKRLHYRGSAAHAENLRKYILFLSQDIRVVLVRLASRIATLKLLYTFPDEARRALALEAMEIHAPLAYQLGVAKFAAELEDLAFPYLYPREYRDLMAMVQDRYEERQAYLAELTPVYAEELRRRGVAVVRIESRAKHYYSLYRKLLRYSMDLSKVYDLVALRAIVETVEDCYAALGAAHRLWPPLSGRVKDYIASPKENGYQSLHTTVATPGERYSEIQIRTVHMNELSEFGVAAHAAYRRAKESKAYHDRRPPLADERERLWLEEVRSWGKGIGNLDALAGRVLALTPKGDVIDLPKGATPVDFAYAVHSDIGSRSVGAVVNGELVPLSQTLNSGDRVEIVVEKKSQPSETWLTFVKTAAARAGIKKVVRRLPGFKEAAPRAAAQIELVVEREDGLLKDLQGIFSQFRVPVARFMSVKKGWLRKTPILRVHCAVADRELLDRLVKALKKHGAVKQARYRLV